jgi:ABC-type bacteriocin/lantibiotic exporter with double-glycine peptidase domain
LALIWAGNKFVFGLAYDLAVALYANMLQKPYTYHTQCNSSEIVAAINKVQMVTSDVLMPLMQSTAAAIIAVFIVAGLLLIDPVITIASGMCFMLIYLCITWITRIRLMRNSTVIARAQTQRVKSLREGLGGIRDVILDNSQRTFVEAYEAAELEFREAQIRNNFFAHAPRFLVEAVGTILITIVAVMVTGRAGGLIEALPVLGTLALGTQRLLPLIQQVYSGWAKVEGNRQNLFDLADLLEHSSQEQPRHVSDVIPLTFRSSIRLEHVSFSYANARGPVLMDVSFQIPKGARVGIAGKSGSGKSTLMDLILGLLVPDAGRILVDEIPLTINNRRAWQRLIAHVPQSIYLADTSIAANIAFGVSPNALDMARVRRAAEQSELADMIADLPGGYETRVGERGIRLSGGQRQRLGIARALYREASILVLDEATSALDAETETAVMDAIAKLDRDLTILIIAHRISTLAGCDISVWMEAGRVAESKNLSSSVHLQAQKAIQPQRRFHPIGNS